MISATTWPRARLRIADADAVRQLAQQLALSTDETFALAVSAGVSELAARAACGATGEQLVREADERALGRGEVDA